MTDKLLDFVVIGASKSGTTSLFQQLRRHPQVEIPAGKDAPFFAGDDRSMAAWRSFAADQFPGAEPGVRWGTVTPRYMEHSAIAGRMHDLVPKARLVAILRNPIDRAFSQYRQQVRQGKEARSFGQVVAEQSADGHASCARSSDPPELATEESYLIRGEYSRILDGYLRHFPASQLHVEFTEDFDRQPQPVLARVFAHLGVDASFVPSNAGERYHQGGSRERFPWLVPVAQRLGPARAVWHRVPLARRQAVLRWFFTTANVKNEAAPEIDDATRGQLVQFFETDVARLADLVGRTPPWSDFTGGAR